MFEIQKDSAPFLVSPHWCIYDKKSLDVIAYIFDGPGVSGEELAEKIKARLNQEIGERI